MIKDAQGQILSGATAEAAALYDQAVRAFNLGYGDAPGLFDAAREASPDFAMAHLAKAWLFALANDPSMLVHARSLVQTAGGLTMNEREQRDISPRCSRCWPVRAARRFRYWTAPDALPVRPRGASGRDAARRLSRALSLGARPDGAGFAVLVEGLAWLWRHARIPRLRP